MRYKYTVLVGKSEGNRLLVSPGHTRENNIKKDIREISGDSMNWIHQSQDRDR
jgi:hypothetical protein